MRGVGGHRWIAHAAGWVCIAAPFWVIISTTVELNPPSFVYAIVGVETACFVGFGVTQFVHIYRHDGHARGVMAVEIAYITQSLISKTLLAILVYSLVLADQFSD